MTRKNNIRYAPMTPADVAATVGMSNIIIAIEEMSELIQVLCKKLRCEGICTYPSRKGVEEVNAGIVEETADVMICLDTLKSLLGITPEELKEIRDYKMQRMTDICAETGIPIKRAKNENEG